MKIRIRSTSVRLRLERDEVEILDRGGEVTEHLSLSPEVDFVYRCKCGEAPDITLEALPMGVQVTLPRSWTVGWATDDRVGFESEVETVPDIGIRVTVEKDFKCLTERPYEDDSGAYPHPGKPHGAADASDGQ